MTVYYLYYKDEDPINSAIAMEFKDSGELRSMNGSLYFKREREIIPMPYYRPHDWVVYFSGVPELVTLEELSSRNIYKCVVGEDGSLSTTLIKRSYPYEGTHDRSTS